MAYFDRLLFIVLALTLSAFCFADEKVKIKTVYVDIGDNLPLNHIHKPNDEVISCKIIDNNGTEFVLYPEPDDSNNRQPGYNKFKLDSSIYLCSVKVWKMTANDSGLMKLQMTVNSTNGIIEKKEWVYNVKVRKLHELNSQKITVFSNQQVSLRFHEKFNDLESCKLLSDEKIEHDLGTDKLPEIKKSGKCGVKMIVRPEHSGVWTLIADLKNNTAYSIAYNIDVKDEKNLNLNQTNVRFKRGDKVTIEIGRSVSPRFCIFEDPHGYQYPLTGAITKGNDRSCQHEIQTVSEYHEGIWKVHYGFDGYQNLVQQEVNFQTYVESYFNSSVTLTNNGDINLLCQIYGENLKFCNFIRPDGEILHMSFGVGNDKYEYYGNSLHNPETFRTERNYDCGITIHKPSAEDIGSWRCLYKFQKSPITGRILKVTSPTDNRITSINPNVTANDVYVKKGDPLKVKCVAQEVLSYCWLRSPSGKVYSFLSMKEDESRNSRKEDHKYVGAGLELGECGVEIEPANVTDNGEWSCHMGVHGGPEIHGSFNVIVKDTHLMAAQDVITVQNKGETDLICQPLPESNQLIEACRWVNPIGYGINVDDSERYITETKATHCKLSIREFDANIDVGEWQCYARFTGLLAEESGARVELNTYRHLGFASGSLSLIMGILLCTFLSVGLILVHRYRLRSKQADEEIILEKSNRFA